MSFCILSSEKIGSFIVDKSPVPAERVCVVVESIIRSVSVECYSDSFYLILSSDSSSYSSFSISGIFYSGT